MIELGICKKLNSADGEMLLQVKLDIEQRTFVTIYGPSGAGKTSLLRILAGLLAPDRGKITVNGSIWTDMAKKLHLPPQKRNVGMVFQDYALFENMTVKDNLLFALQKGQDKNAVTELIDIVRLGDLQHRKPRTLSGGQKQRVALARALVQIPQILMLDEPLSALDHTMRNDLQDYILRLHHQYGLTTIMISHDIPEILKLSDRIIVLDQGKVVNQGDPKDIFTHKGVSGKFQFTGVVITLERQDFMFIVTILIGKDLVKVIAGEDEAGSLQVGDRVMVASKAFNPVISKISGGGK